MKTPTQLLKAIKRRPGLTDEQIDNEAILLRAYGSGTEVLIDRNRNYVPLISHARRWVFSDVVQGNAFPTLCCPSTASHRRSLPASRTD